MKKITSFLKKSIFLIAILLFNQSFAQNGSLSGKVTDLKGLPINGASVSIGSKATTTNEEGSYLLSDLQNGLTTIKVTMSGFADLKKELEISGSKIGRASCRERVSAEV